MAQLIQLPLLAGIEEGVDPKQIPPGTLLVGENCRQDKVGRLRKRRGTTPVVKTTMAGGTIAAGQRLTGAAEALAVNDGTEHHAYLESLEKWQAIDRPPPLLAEQTPLIDAVKSAEAVDQALHNGLLVTVYQVTTTTVNGPIFVFVREVATGAVVLPPTQLTTAGTCPRVVVRTSSGVAYALWNNSSGQIQVRTVTLSTFAVGSVSNLTTGTFASSAFDAQIVSNHLFVASCASIGANRIFLRRFDLNDPTYATVSSVSTGGARADIYAFCVDASDGVSARVIYAADDLVVLVTFNYASSAVTVGPTTLLTSALTGQTHHVFVANHDASNTLVGFVTRDPGSQFKLITYLVTNAAHAEVSNTRRLSFWVFGPSKPWRMSSRWYVRVLSFQVPFLYTDTPPECSSVVLEIRTDAYSAAVPPHRHVATLENQTGWTSFLRAGHLAQPVVDGSDVLVSAAYKNRELTKINATQIDVGTVFVPIGWNQYRLSLSGADLHRVLRLGRVSLGVSAAPYILDGSTTMPAGFAHPPVIHRGEEDSVTPGALDVGVYQYVAVYVWRDANGILYRSVPSPPREVEITLANRSVLLNITTTSVSAHQSEATGFGSSSASPVMMEIYRTKAGGGDFYKLTIEPILSFQFNDLTSHVVAHTDTLADDDIGGTQVEAALDEQPQVYTVQELEDVPPPAALAGAVHRGRFALLAADRRTVAFSKVAGEDLSIFPGFNEALTLLFDREKYALASLDERLVALGADHIDLVEGDGPDSNGDANTWKVVGLQTDAGTTNPRSVVSIPAGLIFQSTEGGLVLLTRELAIKWVGRSVEDRLAAFPVITSAVLVAEEHEVRFTCNAEDGLSGIVLVLDYERGAWYVRKYYDADSASTSMPIADAALIDGVYTMLLSGGRVYRETSAHCLDAGSQFVKKAVEIYVAPSGNQGWSRLKDVQLLGTSLTHHDLTVSVARDFATSFEQTKTFPAQGDVTTPGPLEKANVTVARQKGQAFRVRVEDATPTSGSVGTGEGFLLEGLALHVQPKPGPAKASSGRKG